ncbi:MAG: site-specific DNA-methyltransferase [bacterium]|nr:site-specific DNA-methyltransferase [bacterium]
MDFINSLITGDCVEVMRSWPDECIDLTVTSPPYDNLRNYEGYEFPFDSIARELLRITKDGGVVVWVVGDKIKNGRSLTSLRQAIHFQEIGFNVHDIMIYQKRNTPFMRSNAYTNAYELMVVLAKGKPKTFNPLKIPTARHGYEMLTHNKGPDGVNKKTRSKLNKEKTRTNIWSYAVGLGGTTRDRIAFQHPAVFPEKLAEDHILSWTNPGDLVLDPMCGSGTTCKMAVATERNYVGIDIAPEYIEIARQRVAAVQQRILLSGHFQPQATAAFSAVQT